MSPFSGGLATVAEVATAAEAGGVFTLTWLLVGLPLTALVAFVSAWLARWLWLAGPLLPT